MSNAAFHIGVQHHSVEKLKAQLLTAERAAANARDSQERHSFTVEADKCAGYCDSIAAEHAAQFSITKDAAYDALLITRCLS